MAHLTRMISSSTTRWRAQSDEPNWGSFALGEILVRLGALTSKNLLRALALQPHQKLPIGEILIARGWLSEADLATGLSLQNGIWRADFRQHPPDWRLLEGIDEHWCLTNGVLPWMRCGSVTLVAVADANSEAIALCQGELERRLGTVSFVVSTQGDIRQTLERHRRNCLSHKAEMHLPYSLSSRVFGTLHVRIWAGFLALVGLALFAAFPIQAFSALVVFGAATLAASTALKFAASFHRIFRNTPPDPQFVSSDPSAWKNAPNVSLIVPLLHESQLLSQLVTRLERLNYPPEHLDIWLVVEADDATTNAALAGATLPSNFHVLEVPKGTVKTKPRALNYALNFCRGDIIGVYDAEDAPAENQIQDVVRMFENSDVNTACIQGVLDFYNARQNWLSRCFTIDYAIWFRVILPGLQRMGMPVPLGGTTLFLRRSALVDVGGWDAQNVTEDAELGIRLARHGYKTKLMTSVTEEEANCRAWPWIRQRSRWLKGYALTWMSHMRNPRALWGDLGAKGFCGFQIIFLGALSQFLLAPAFWSFWLLLLGLWHPFQDAWPTWALLFIGILFFTSEIMNIVIGWVAVSSARHKWLTLWVPTLHLYYPLGSFAAWKAVFDAMLRPFHWDKTAHGHSLR